MPCILGRAYRQESKSKTEEFRPIEGPAHVSQRVSQGGGGQLTTVFSRPGRRQKSTELFYGEGVNVTNVILLIAKIEPNGSKFA